MDLELSKIYKSRDGLAHYLVVSFEQGPASFKARCVRTYDFEKHNFGRERYFLPDGTPLATLSDPWLRLTSEVKE